jgi:hypothetical protein
MRVSRPRVASSLLGWILPARDVEVVIGDLEEEYRLRSPASGSALPWYWMQVFRSMPVLLWVSIRRGEWLLTAGVVIAACVVQAAIELTVNAARSNLVSPDTSWPVALSACVTLASLLAVSYAATRIRPAAGMWLTAMVVVAVAVQVAFKGSQGAAMWIRLSTLLLGVSMTMAGAMLSRRTRRS